MNTLTLTKNEILNPDINFEYFIDFAQDFVAKIKSGDILTKKKVMFSNDTIRQYNVSIGHFEEFEAKLESKIKVYEINKRMLEAYEKHLYSTGLLYNSVYLYISKIKALANVLYDTDVIIKPLKFDTPKKITTQVYLSQQELKAMRSCDKLTNSEKRVLDIFLIQCFTGLRYSSLVEFLSNPTAYIKNHSTNCYIDIVSKKTGEQSVIPMSLTVFEILNKYEFKFQLLSEEYFNRTLKNIGEKAEINTPIAIQVTRNSITETVIKPKFLKISSHTGRRSFCTIAKMYINNEDAILSMTAHSSTAQLKNYIRSEKVDRIANVFENDFFKIKI